MKLLSLSVVATFLAACSNAPPVDNPSAPRPPRSDAEQKIEARSLEQEQARCAKEGKTAVATRVENSTLYSCVAPAQVQDQSAPKR
jgi:hypothetical protein